MLKKRETAADFISEYSLTDDDVIMYADEEDGMVGLTALRLEPGEGCERTLRILAAQYTDEDVLEMLLRGAFSYGERRFARGVLINFEQPADLLARLGFRQIDGQLRSSVENVVHMCRNCAESSE